MFRRSAPHVMCLHASKQTASCSSICILRADSDSVFSLANPQRTSFHIPLPSGRFLPLPLGNLFTPNSASKSSRQERRHERGNGQRHDDFALKYQNGTSRPSVLKAHSVMTCWQKETADKLIGFIHLGASCLAGLGLDFAPFFC